MDRVGYKPLDRPVSRVVFEAADPEADSQECLRACAVACALWLKYRYRNPTGLTHPPIGGAECSDTELAGYCRHIVICERCKRANA